MILQSLFEQLTSGELRKVKLGGSRDTSRTISPDDYFIVIPAINLGLTKLFARLPLKKDSIIIEQHEQIANYVLSRRYAATNTNSDAPFRYLLDSRFEPFEGPVVSIERVVDQAGSNLPISDANDLHSVYVTSHNTVQFPYPRNKHFFEVMYRAGLPNIPIEGLDPHEYELDIPEYAMLPLLNFVRARLEIGAIKGENVSAEMQALIQFENECKAVEASSLIPSTTYTKTRIEKEGWV